MMEKHTDSRNAEPAPLPTLPTLTKAELADVLFDGIGLNKREAKEMVDDFFAEIAGALQEGDEVKLTMFGTFKLRQKPERPGRNPKTGEAVPIRARRVVTFHASPKLKAQVEVGLLMPTAQARLLDEVMIDE